MTFKLRNDCNRNFSLSCATSFDLTNKRAIGQKAFKDALNCIQYVNMKAALNDGSKFEKQLLVHLLCVFQMDVNFLARIKL